jgi:hypothetical protein
MTWRMTLFIAVAVALLGSAASLWAHEPGDAVGPYRERETASCRCAGVRP